MEAHVLAQGKREPPQIADMQMPIFDLSGNPSIIFCVVEGGMASGEPSVMICSTSQAGTILLQTSLDKFLMGASGMSAMAENLWGWKRPEGYASIVPGLPKETKRAILESLKRELEETDEVDGEHCHDCGRTYQLVWTAPDGLWRDVTGWDESGLLCPDCFSKRAFEKNLFIRFVPQLEHKNETDTEGPIDPRMFEGDD